VHDSESPRLQPGQFAQVLRGERRAGPGVVKPDERLSKSSGSAAESVRHTVTRWLFHGLHSLDLPWLYRHRPLWDITVIALMLGGTALCATSLVLAWRVLARKIASAVGLLARHELHRPVIDRP